MLLLQFDRCFKRVNTYLKLIGLTIDSDGSKKTMIQRFKKHRMYFIHEFSFNLSVTGELIWLIQGIVFGYSLWEITYMLPCLMVCLLGNFKIYFFTKHMHHVSELVNVLRNLQSKAVEDDEEIVKECKEWLTFLSSTCKLLLISIYVGVLAFALGPFVIIGSYYLSTGEIKLVLPYIVWYPFNAFDIRIWPFIYLHQLWSAWVAVFSVFGPDCFFITCCTFIQIQFLKLQYDMERIVKEGARHRSDVTLDTFKAELVQLVNKHRQLIRCVNLLEIIYSKSTLFNAVTSSMTICATGFNLMAIKNLTRMAPFFSFLTFGSLQIFFYCYYGDYVMRSSMGVGDAVFKSNWYETGAAERKFLLIVLLRSHTPCSLTAYGFTVINLRAFTRIMSTSWSYFALLKQIYN